MMNLGEKMTEEECDSLVEVGQKILFNWMKLTKVPTRRQILMATGRSITR